jgi:condensin complex subunit 1
MSKTNSDVFEAIDLFTAAYMFGIKGTEPGMRQMLFLVWSPDKEKRDCVVEAYKKVLFTTDSKDPRAHAVRAVQNLCGFIENLTAGQYSAMETLVNEWTKEAVINDQMIQVLFQMYTQRMEGISDNQARLALDMLTLCSV